MDTAILQFLFDYRSTPHSTRGKSPVQIFYGRELKTRFDLLRPNLRLKVEEKQSPNSVTPTLTTDRVKRGRYHDGRPLWESRGPTGRRRNCRATIALNFPSKNRSWNCNKKAYQANNKTPATIRAFRK